MASHVKRRGLFIWDRKARRGRGDWIPASQYRGGYRSTRGPMVQRDYADIVSPVTGEVISGRAAHREHMKRHGLVCIGDDRIKTKVPEVKPVRETLREVMQYPREKVEGMARQAYERKGVLPE